MQPAPSSPRISLAALGLLLINITVKTYNNKITQIIYETATNKSLMFSQSPKP